MSATVIGGSRAQTPESAALGLLATLAQDPGKYQTMLEEITRRETQAQAVIDQAAQDKAASAQLLTLANAQAAEVKTQANTVLQAAQRKAAETARGAQQLVADQQAHQQAVQDHQEAVGAFARHQYEVEQGLQARYAAVEARETAVSNKEVGLGQREQAVLKREQALAEGQANLQAKLTALQAAMQATAG